MNEESMDQSIQQPPTQEAVAETPQVQEQPQQVSEEPVAQSEAPKNNSFEENVKNLREAKQREAERAAKAEYERDQMAQYIQNIKNQLAPQQQPQEQGLQDDDYVEGKDFNKVTKQMQQMKQELNQWRNYSEEMTAELKLNTEFSDFNNVVTADNVKTLLKQYPELKPSVQNNDPLYNRGKATYRLIKKFIDNDKKQPVNMHNQTKVEANTGKPMPTSAIKSQQTSPLSTAGMLANGYNEEVGEALEKEMYDAIARY